MGQTARADDDEAKRADKPTRPRGCFEPEGTTCGCFLQQMHLERNESKGFVGALCPSFSGEAQEGEERDRNSLLRERPS